MPCVTGAAGADTVVGRVVFAKHFSPVPSSKEFVSRAKAASPQARSC